MNLILFLLLGGLVGWIAGLITGDDGGILKDIVVGIVGSFLAGTAIEYYNAGHLDIATTLTGFHWSSIIVSTIGAIILIAIMRLFSSKS